MYAAGGLLVMAVIGLVAALASQSVAHAQALDDAVRTTNRIGIVVFEPLLPGYLRKEAAATRQLADDVADRKIGGRLTELTVWAGDGTVLYSDQAEEVGRRARPSVEVVAAVQQGRSTSAFKNRQSPDPANTVNEPGYGDRYVEVYVPLRIDGQPPLALEAYFDYQQVDDLASEILRQSLPLVLGPLVLLGLIQVPVILSLGKRLRRHEEDRSRLLERALAASDEERLRFAADLHDGPIQDLAGIGYALGAIAPGVAPEQAPLMQRVEAALGRSIASLRSLMSDLYPPDLGAATIETAIDELAKPLRAEGIEVRVAVGELSGVEPDTVASAYRVAREALVNVRKHARATNVGVTLSRSDPTRLRLVVSDDGVGLDPLHLDRRGEGHLGLRLLAERVDGLGGTLRVTSAPGEGTSLVADLPVASG